MKIESGKERKIIIRIPYHQDLVRKLKNLKGGGMKTSGIITVQQHSGRDKISERGADRKELGERAVLNR